MKIGVVCLFNGKQQQSITISRIGKEEKPILTMLKLYKMYAV